MSAKIQFTDLTKQQCEQLFYLAFYERPDDTFTFNGGDVALFINTDKYQLCIEYSGKISAGVDRGVSDQYSPHELEEGTAIRKWMTAWGVPGFTEPDFITWLGTQKNYDQNIGHYFFGTYLMGPYHYVTVFRASEDEPFTYIIHGSSHDADKEFCRTTDYYKFMEAMDKISSWSLDYQQEKFEAPEEPKRPIKTKEGWDKSGLNLSEYLPEPCEIDEELYMYIGEVVAPHYLGENLMQGGDPYNKILGYEGDDIHTYETVSEINGKYFYLGVLPEFRQ